LLTPPPCANPSPSPPAARPAAGQANPIASAQGLISRLLGASYVPAFALEVIPADPATGNDAFEIDTNGTAPVLRGNTGVALASALHWYLKYYCGASIGWGRDGTGNQLASVPAPGKLPLPASVYRAASNVKYRYYYNVCTYGYSTAW
jgi:alpha-N-acetylglucosaminidase